MPRTSTMAQLRRALRIAFYCESSGVSPQEAIEAGREKIDRKRRSVITAIAASAAAPLLGHAPRSLAVPRFNGGVAIVGAGLAGLSCAYQLSAKGISAPVYEASSRVGGRCWSLRNFFPGQVAERGGEFIDTTHTTMRGFANAFGLALEEVTKEPGEVAYYFDGRHYSEAQVVEEFRQFVPAMKADLRDLGQPIADSFSQDDRRLDLTSLADYLASRGAGPLIRQVIDVAYTIEYGLDISKQSCLNFLLFIHADRRSKFHPFGVFSDERFHVTEGNDAITQGLANRLAGQISTDHKLVRAKRLSSGRVQLAFSVGGRTIESEHDAVILTLPFSVLRSVDLDPSLALPDWKTQAISEFQYGTNSKMMLGFTGRPWLTLHHSNGTSYSDLPNLQNTWETNPALATSASAILTHYSGAALGQSLLPAKVQTHAGSFLRDLEKIYPGASAQAARNAAGKYLAHVENWSLNPLALGAYSCNAPGYFTSIAGNEAKPVGNLFFAGEHTDSFYAAQGFMEGAALSGLRAAAEVTTFLKHA
ncbi:MAG: flavin monoamine oxidase family protein [Burkholderiales bacterium]